MLKIQSMERYVSETFLIMVSILYQIIKVLLMLSFATNPYEIVFHTYIKKHSEKSIYPVNQPFSVFTLHPCPHFFNRIKIRAIRRKPKYLMPMLCEQVLYFLSFMKYSLIHHNYALSRQFRYPKFIHPKMKYVRVDFAIKETNCK